MPSPWWPDLIATEPLSDGADGDCHPYILFAVMGSSTPALALESAVACTFLVLAVAGFKKNLWLVVATLAGHGVFEFFHRPCIQNPGVPMWWPGFCLSFDILAGGFLALLLMRRSGFAVHSSQFLRVVAVILPATVSNAARLARM